MTREFTMLARLITLLLCVGATFAAQGDDIDSDRDGLPDFQESHKYFTNPQAADSDSDGVRDDDWHERREYSYTIRSIVKVMRPCDPAAANDDYQDARLLSESSSYVELEVVHYPLNTNAAAIEESRDWQQTAKEFQGDLQPGVTTNWDDDMRRDLIAALE